MRHGPYGEQVGQAYGKWIRAAANSDGPGRLFELAVMRGEAQSEADLEKHASAGFQRLRVVETHAWVSDDDDTVPIPGTGLPVYTSMYDDHPDLRVVNNPDPEYAEVSDAMMFE